MPTATSDHRPWYDRPLPLGRIAGIPVSLSTSWFFIAVIMVVLFAPRIRLWLPGVGWAVAGLTALGYTVVLAVSVLVHELGHAVVARSVGWRGSTIEITLWGGHTTFEEVHSGPGRSLLVSVIGPVLNLLLAGLGFLALRLGEPTGVAATLLIMFAWSNLILGVFNLLPGLPLDGGRFVESIGWRATGSRAKGTIAAGWAGRILTVLGAAAAILGWLQQRSVPPLLVLVIAVAVLFPLWTGAGAALDHGRIRLKVEGIDPAELLEPVTLVPATATVADAEAAGVLTGTVVMSGSGTGHEPRVLRILPEAVAAVPPGLRASTPVSSAAVDAADTTSLPVDADGDHVVEAVLATDSGTVLIVGSDGAARGVIRRENVIAALEGGPRKKD